MSIKKDHSKPFIKWINPSQRAVLGEMLADDTNEEQNFFWELRRDLQETISTMPKTYDTENIDDPMVHLHYFLGGWDWYITEKDIEEEQNQAFGLVKSSYCPNGELGYISIPELLRNNAELDYHFNKAPLSTFKNRTYTTMKHIKNEQQPDYLPPVTNKSNNDIIRQAMSILENRLIDHEITVNNPHDSADFLKLKLSELEHEVFAVMFLDNQHQMIKYEEMFRGTIDGASVYPREVVKEALKLNAAAIIIAHNHPSAIPEPSQADERITHRIREACSLMDIRLLDHIIVGGTKHTSLAERGVI